MNCQENGNIAWISDNLHDNRLAWFFKSLRALYDLVFLCDNRLSLNLQGRENIAWIIVTVTNPVLTDFARAWQHCMHYCFGDRIPVITDFARAGEHCMKYCLLYDCRLSLNIQEHENIAWIIFFLYDNRLSLKVQEHENIAWIIVWWNIAAYHWVGNVTSALHEFVFYL